MRHSLAGRPIPAHRYVEPMAAGSLYTNARDYARFILALLEGTGLSEKLATEMITPQVRVEQDETGELYWGLGLGLVRSKRGDSLWHHGDNGDCKAYFEVFRPSRSGIVYFANGRNGLAIAPALLEAAFGRRDAGLLKKPFAYATIESPKIQLHGAYARAGAEGALEIFRKSRRDTVAGEPISEGEILDLAREALWLGDVRGVGTLAEAAIETFPGSVRGHAVLGAAHLLAGRREEALRSLERAESMGADVDGELRRLERIFLEMEKSEEAIKILQPGCALHPGSARCLEVLAKAFLGKGDLPAAIEAFEKALKIDPGSEAAREGLKRCGTRSLERSPAPCLGQNFGPSSGRRP